MSQVINEVTQQANPAKKGQSGHFFQIYDLYNIIELDNNTLLSCNSHGIKFYNFINNQYKLVNVIPMFLDVRNVIQINPNNSLIIHHSTERSGICLPSYDDKFALSLFDLKSNKIINTIFEHEIKYSGYNNYKFNYCLIGDNYIYQICDFPYDNCDIYENKKDSLSFEFHIYNNKNGENFEDEETSFHLISYFKDNLIFAEKDKSLNVFLL